MIQNNLKQKIKAWARLGLWALFPVILGISVVSLATLPFQYINQAKIREPKNNTTLAAQSLSSEEIRGQEKSKYFYLNKDTDGRLKVSAAAFLVGDLNTGEVLLSKNQEKKFPIASVSKLMTALVASEVSDENDIALVSKEALSTEGSNGNFRVGEKIKTADLLYPLLLESSNDAAEIIAEHFGRENFIAEMNKEAGRIKMSDTKYEDPSGLSPNNQSTVSDMFKLTGYLKAQKPEILSITLERSFSNNKHSWSNISRFLGENGYLGGKSGYTDPAKQTVVSIFNLPLGEYGVRPIAITLLQSADRHKDVENILKYLKSNIYYGGKADANTNWVEGRVGAPVAIDPNFINLAFAGDIMMDRGVKNSVRKNFNNDYSAIFDKSQELKDIFKKSDITFANLEGPVSDMGADLRNLYSFRMDPEVIPALKGAGISVLSVANNHIGDWGRPAYVDTLARAKENEIFYAGGGLNKEEAETPAIIEKYGMKIGFLGFSDKGPGSMEAGIDKAGQLLASDPRFDEIIQSARKQVDYLVVSFHFGEEYQTKHNARQEYLAHLAVDDGAKLVIGSHPHVIEDTEVYKNSFIAYSLGNFIFDQSWSASTMQGGLLEIKLNRDGSMIAKLNTIELNSAFQPEKIIAGKEEKIIPD